MDLAKVFVRTVVRAFYTTEYVLVIDALALHSTLPDKDLAHVLGMQPKHVRRLLGLLQDHGLISKQTRGERREGAPKYYSNAKDNGQPLRERLANVEWYYINFHNAIDNIKWRLWKLRQHIEKQGAPTTEKKDLHCPRCKNQYTELEVLDHLDGSGNFLCHRCNHVLEMTEDQGGIAENQEMKRLNLQLAEIISQMQKIDATTVPENDFDTALRYALPIKRSDQDPGTRGEAVDLPKPALASSKGMAMAPEQVLVDLADDEQDGDNAAGTTSSGPTSSRSEREKAELLARREREAKQNALPDWITRSTVSGGITTVGAKEAAARAERDQHLGGLAGAVGAGADEGLAAETKSAVDDKSAIDQYYAQLAAEQKANEDQADEESEDDDDDADDGFEGVEGVATQPVIAAAAPALNGVDSVDTSGMVSSNATDDERETKRVRIQDADGKTFAVPAGNGVNGRNGTGQETQNSVPKIVTTSEAADSDEDDFEDV